MQLRPHQVRILERMQTYTKGQIIVPTGGGKTMCMIQDTAHVQQSKCGHTTVVVAPRILLAEQLCSEFLEVITSTYTHVMHVHSGETHHFSTTNSEKIHVFANTARNMGEDCIIFTTYHSLHRVVDADIEVNTIYFDEAHNSVQRNFFGPTEHFAAESDRCYFFTATPKHSLTIKKPGMNDTAVYGQVLVNVPAPELVEGGYILPPKVVVKQLDMVQDKMKVWSRDCDFLMQTIDDQETEKVLVCARTTKQIIGLLTDSDFALECAKRGMSWMTITSKTGAIIDGQKVNREVFFDTLNAWGKDPNKKFVVLHRSILSEGINVSELEGVVFMRNMDAIEMTQTIGRVIRIGQKSKTYGMLCVPVYSNVGVSTQRSLQRVVDIVFEQGEMLDSVVKR